MTQSDRLAILKRWLATTKSRQATLANTLGVSQNAVSAWMTGKTPTPQYAAAYCKADLEHSQIIADAKAIVERATMFLEGRA